MVFNFQFWGLLEALSNFGVDKKSPDATRGHFLTIQVDLPLYKHYHKFFGEQIFDLVYSVPLAQERLNFSEIYFLSFVLITIERSSWDDNMAVQNLFYFSISWLDIVYHIYLGFIFAGSSDVPQFSSIWIQLLCTVQWHLQNMVKLPMNRMEQVQTGF